MQSVKMVISIHGFDEVMDNILAHLGEISLDIPNMHKKLIKMVDEIDVAKKTEWKEKIYQDMGDMLGSEESSDEDDWEDMVRS